MVETYKIPYYGKIGLGTQLEKSLKKPIPLFQTFILEGFGAKSGFKDKGQN